MLTTYKFLAFFWPFLKEMFLGDKTAKEAFRYYKGRLIVICTIVGSLLLNFFTVPRLINISSQYVFLKKKHAEVSLELDKLKLTVAELQQIATTPLPPPTPVEPAAQTPIVREKEVKPPTEAATSAKSRHDSVREAFELMQRSEKHAD